MAAAISGGSERFREAFARQQMRMRAAAAEKERQIAVGTAQYLAELELR